MSVIVQNEIDDTTVPNPATGKIALFIDEADSKLKGKKPDGSVVFIGTTPLHADTHHTGGTDALVPADIGAAAATHAHAGTDITSGTVASARLPSASGTTAGIVPTTSGSATGDKLRVKADGTLEWYTPALDETKVSKLYESDGGAAAVEVDAAGVTNVVGGKLNVIGDLSRLSEAVRNFNVIGPQGVLRILRNHPSTFNSPAVELRQEDPSDNSLLAYWDFYASSANEFIIRERKYTNENLITMKATSDGTLSMGFFNKTPIARPSITGSRGGNAALASLLTALDTLGLIDDNTTA